MDTTDAFDEDDDEVYAWKRQIEILKQVEIHHLDTEAISHALYEYVVARDLVLLCLLCCLCWLLLRTNHAPFSRPRTTGTTSRNRRYGTSSTVRLPRPWPPLCPLHLARPPPTPPL